MKKNKHIQTSFLKFLLEKHSEEQKEKVKKKHIIEDEEETDEDDIEPLDEIDEDELDLDDEKEDDTILEELINEYKKIKKRYESNKLHNRRK